MRKLLISSSSSGKLSKSNRKSIGSIMKPPNGSRLSSSAPGQRPADGAVLLVREVGLQRQRPLASTSDRFWVQFRVKTLLQFRKAGRFRGLYSDPRSGTGRA